MGRINLCNLINDLIFLFPDIMVRNYKRRSDKGVSDSGIMQRAVHQVVQNGGCSVSRLALHRAAMPNIFLSFFTFFISLLSVA